MTIEENYNRVKSRFTFDEFVLVYHKAIRDFEELEKMVDDANENHLTLEEMSNKTESFNLSEELFDLNFKSLTTTICWMNDKLELIRNVEIWNGMSEINLSFDVPKEEIYNELWNK